MKVHEKAEARVSGEVTGCYVLDNFERVFGEKAIYIIKKHYNINNLGFRPEKIEFEDEDGKKLTGYTSLTIARTIVSVTTGKEYRVTNDQAKNDLIELVDVAIVALVDEATGYQKIRMEGVLKTRLLASNSTFDITLLHILDNK